MRQIAVRYARSEFVDNDYPKPLGKEDVAEIKRQRKKNQNDKGEGGEVQT